MDGGHAPAMTSFATNESKPGELNVSLSIHVPHSNIPKEQVALALKQAVDAITHGTYVFCGQRRISIHSNMVHVAGAIFRRDHRAL